MKFLVMGAGAVGAWIGGCLARGGHAVTFVGRKPFVEAVNVRGLRITLPDGTTWEISSARVVLSVTDALGSAAEARQSPYDAVLLCVKAYALGEALRDLRPESGWLGPATQVVCFQNGVGSEELAAAEFGPERIIAGTLTSAVSVLQPGAIRLERESGGIGLAPFSPGDAENLAGLAALAGAMTQAGLRVRTYGEYHAMKWSKLFLNSMANASSAILDMTAEQVYGDRHLFRFEMAMLRETAAVMRADGISLVNLPGFPAVLLGLGVRFVPDPWLQPLLLRIVARGRGGKRPSFSYDVANRTGRCEVSYLNGAVVARGRKLGVPTPVNTRLNDVLMGLVNRQLIADEWRGAVGRLTIGVASIG
jgi:2-dehydropantoate 2-reductase